MRAVSFLLLSTLFCGSLSGCIYVKQMAAGPEMRQEMLTKQLPVFNQAVYWGKMEEATQYVDPAIRADFMNRAAAARKAENMVEMSVDKVEFGDEANDATVDVIVRYFKRPQYVVKERREQQAWAFSKAEGWLFKGTEVMTDGEVEAPASLRGAF